MISDCDNGNGEGGMKRLRSLVDSEELLSCGGGGNDDVMMMSLGYRTGYRTKILCHEKNRWHKVSFSFIFLAERGSLCLRKA